MQDPTQKNNGSDPKAGDRTLEQAEQELAELREEVARLRDMAARAQADLQNARARLEKEGQDMRQFAAEGMARRLLPTVDNFKRAFAHLPDDLQSHEWVKGLQAVEQGFLRELADAGLQPMESLGQPVDTNRHEVLQSGPGEKDIVTEVFEEGYMLHDRVLRPARVKVGNGEV